MFNNQEKLLLLVEMMYCAHGFTLPCFKKGEQTIEDLKNRLSPPGIKSVADQCKHVDDLIRKSNSNWTTKWYDYYQYYFQGIL